MSVIYSTHLSLRAAGSGRQLHTWSKTATQLEGKHPSAMDVYLHEQSVSLFLKVVLSHFFNVGKLPDSHGGSQIL